MDKVETVGVPSVSSVYCARRKTTAVGYNTLPYQPPQGDQKFARQGHNHGLAEYPRAFSVRDRQTTSSQAPVLLVVEGTARPIELCGSSDPAAIAPSRPDLSLGVAPYRLSSGEPSEAGITRYGPSKSHRMFRRPQHGSTPDKAPLPNRRSASPHVCFSNRPVGVKHFQATHHCNVESPMVLALLFGIGTRAVPSGDLRAPCPLFAPSRPNNGPVGMSVGDALGRC